MASITALVALVDEATRGLDFLVEPEHPGSGLMDLNPGFNSAYIGPGSCEQTERPSRIVNKPSKVAVRLQLRQDRLRQALGPSP